MRPAVILAAAVLISVPAFAQDSFRGVEGELTPLPPVTALQLDLEEPGGLAFEIARPTDEQLGAYDDGGIVDETSSFQRPSIHNAQRSRSTRLTGLDLLDELLR